MTCRIYLKASAS